MPCQQAWELNFLDCVAGCVRAGSDITGHGWVPALRPRGTDSLTLLAEFSPVGLGEAFAFTLLLLAF